MVDVHALTQTESARQEMNRELVGGKRVLVWFDVHGEWSEYTPLMLWPTDFDRAVLASCNALLE